MLRINGDTILLDDFEVATIRQDIPPSQRAQLDAILDTVDDILKSAASTCEECGRMVVGSE